MTEQSERMVRVPEGRFLAGVCTGLGTFTGIDPLVYRVGFALLVLAHGQGVLLYVAAVLLLPAAPDRPAVADGVFRRWFDGETVLVILGALLGLAFILNVTTAGVFNGHRAPAGDALTSLTVLAVAVLVAHARGVRLTALVRSIPERLRGRPAPGRPERAGPSRPGGPVHAAGEPLPEGMVDLAVYGLVPADGRTTPRAAETPYPPASQTSPYKAAAPYDTSARTSKPPPAHRPLSVLTPVTLLLALIATAAVIPAATGAPSRLGIAQILLATALTAVGLGLVAGSLRGRGRGLVVVGALLSISLTATSILGEVPVNGRYGDVRWHPVDTSTTERNYRVIIGDGRLDLTGLPLTPGQRTIVNAQFVLGALKVTLPRTARAELHLKVGLGDITVGKRITSGPRARVDTVLQPRRAGSERAAGAPVIELRVQGRVGDLAVDRV